MYFSAFISVLKFSLLFIQFPTVHPKTNFLVNLYWDNKYSDFDFDSDLVYCIHYTDQTDVTGVTVWLPVLRLLTLASVRLCTALLCTVCLFFSEFCHIFFCMFKLLFIISNASQGTLSIHGWT